jgi:hypothetical protein
MSFQPAICLTCHTPFTARRRTAQYCGDACRKAAQRKRDRGLPLDMPANAPGVAADAIISVTGAPASPATNVTLTQGNWAPSTAARDFERRQPRGVIQSDWKPSGYGLDVPNIPSFLSRIT